MVQAIARKTQQTGRDDAQFKADLDTIRRRLNDDDRRKLDEYAQTDTGRAALATYLEHGDTVDLPSSILDILEPLPCGDDDNDQYRVCTPVEKLALRVLLELAIDGPLPRAVIFGDDGQQFINTLSEVTHTLERGLRLMDSIDLGRIVNAKVTPND